MYSKLKGLIWKQSKSNFFSTYPNVTMDHHNICHRYGILSFSLLVWELVCDICSLVSMVFQVALSLLLCNSNLIILDCQLVFN